MVGFFSSVLIYHFFNFFFLDLDLDLDLNDLVMML